MLLPLLRCVWLLCSAHIVPTQLTAAELIFVVGERNRFHHVHSSLLSGRRCLRTRLCCCCMQPPPPPPPPPLLLLLLLLLLLPPPPPLLLLLLPPPSQLPPPLPPRGCSASSAAP